MTARWIVKSTVTRRTFMAGALSAPLAGASFTSLRAQAGPIKLIVPVPPGGTLDPIARLVQQGLQEKLGVTVVVENRPGASGSVGTAEVVRSAPDGNTWLFVYETHAINPFLRNLPFNTETDLEPIQLIATAPAILAKHAARPWRDLGELIAAAKDKPDSISYATTGSGSIGHLAMTMLAERAGVRMVHVPYRGGGPAMNDAIGGHVDTIIGSVALTTPQIRAQKIVGLLNFGANRVAGAPDVPTAAENGFPGLEAYAWWGVFAPRGTPAEIKGRFARLIASILREDANARKLTEAQFDLRLNGPDELRDFVAGQMQTWGQVVKRHGIKDG